MTVDTEEEGTNPPEIWQKCYGWLVEGALEYQSIARGFKSHSSRTLRTSTTVLYTRPCLAVNITSEGGLL